MHLCSDSAPKTVKSYPSRRTSLPGSHVVPMAFAEFPVPSSMMDRTDYFLAGRAGHEPVERRTRRIEVLMWDVHSAIDYVPLVEMTLSGPDGLEMYLADLRLGLAYTAELSPSDIQAYPSNAFSATRPASKEEFARVPGPQRGNAGMMCSGTRIVRSRQLMSFLCQCK